VFAFVYSLSLASVKCKDKAEDILQECFLRVWEKAATFNSVKGGVYIRLTTMTRNRAIDRLRSKNFQCRRRQHVILTPSWPTISIRQMNRL
jgi:RNA polymerase sigma-70 factor (ECF subfamily)